MRLLLGYNTNGFAHHRLEDALAVLAGLGYRSVAITLDHHVLYPFADNWQNEAEHVRVILDRFSLRSVIETGARFVLDPWRKHQPTLVSSERGERRKRLDFLKRAVDIAQRSGSDLVSFWSGASAMNQEMSVQLERLAEGCRELCDYAGERGIRLGFEPEPGMLIDTMSIYGELATGVNRVNFGLTLDVGHLHCLGEIPIARHLHRWREKLWNIHIEDMRRGVHEHLMFGEGEIDFAAVLQGLKDINYRGGVHVELSRHGHDAVAIARAAFAFLRGVEETILCRRIP
jgi:sugar phosphate isomerase/epimerase